MLDIYPVLVKIISASVTSVVVYAERQCRHEIVELRVAHHLHQAVTV